MRAARGKFLPFGQARAVVRKLKLQNKKEWEAWRKSGARPHDIPSTPQTTYASSGWTSYGDFLGYAVGQSANASLGEMTSSDLASESAAAEAAAASAASVAVVAVARAAVRPRMDWAAAPW